ncbi:MAG: hydantoinase/oxoprolinase family protein [Candidatus Baltobacteraceae bacterium]
MIRVGIDVGGTFTDLVAVDMTTGQRHIVKCPSTPRAPEEGVLQALDRLFARFERPPAIEYLAHSTTIATNALLGQMHLELPRVVFVTTSGFRDVVEIGRQNRSEVYNLRVTRPKPLAAREDRIGAHERMDYRGEVLEALTAAECERVEREVCARNPDAVAIGFLHAYANDTHERLMAAALERALPGIPITQSAQVDPEYREYERFSTALVNAALLPIVQRYIDRLRAALRQRGIDVPLYVMQSNGGMASAQRVALQPAAIIESGPASGVIAAADLAREQQAQRILSFDMGGTTAKAGTVLDGAVQIANEFEAAGSTHSGRSVKGSGYPVRFPFVDLAEISAGGGTIAFVDEAGALRVGPLSAGADPGPACYGNSTRATVTDANVVLGRLSGEALAGGTLPIDASLARAAISQIAAAVGLSVEVAAEGIVRIVDAQMAKVLRIVTVERGLDPRDFTMVAFGGNGPLHACSLADELGIRRVLIPADPGVFSAFGLLVAPLRASFVQPVMRRADEVCTADLAALSSELHVRGQSAMREQGAHAAKFTVEYDARYRGQSFELNVAGASEPRLLAERFHEAHRRRYGYDVQEEAVEIVNARLGAAASLRPLPHRQTNDAPHGSHVTMQRALWLDGGFAQVPVHRRESLQEGLMLAGPALIEQYDTCTFVAPQWQARTSADALLLERT